MTIIFNAVPTITPTADTKVPSIPPLVAKAVASAVIPADIPTKAAPNNTKPPAKIATEAEIVNSTGANGANAYIATPKTVKEPANTNNDLPISFIVISPISSNA